MSIDFYIGLRAADGSIRGEQVDDLNLANENAREVLMELGVRVKPGRDADLLWGHHGITLDEMIERCQVRLARPEGLTDLGTAPSEENGGRVIHCGRRAGYVREKVRRLLHACLTAEASLGSGATIYWG